MMFIDHNSQVFCHRRLSGDEELAGLITPSRLSRLSRKARTLAYHYCSENGSEGFASLSEIYLFSDTH